MKRLKKCKTCGPSGLGPTHLRYLCKCEKAFIIKLTTIFNILLKFPGDVVNVPLLYKFRSVFIPKDLENFRPIAISEQFLLVFHKLVISRLRD